MNFVTWEQIQQQLKNQMTAATYQQWLALATGRAEGETLTITAPSEIGREWLDKRLRPMIERTTGLNLVVRCEGDRPVEIKGDYISDYAKIVKPEKVEVNTQYFRRVWRPLLGPVLSELIRELRQRCYYGRGEDRERRNTAVCTQTELATAIGVSRATIKRVLKRDENGNFENKHLNKFILDIAIQTRLDHKTKGVVNDATVFTVALDEPIFEQKPYGSK